MGVENIKARFFNSLEIDRSHGILTKRSMDGEKLSDEIRWYNQLPKSLQYIHPQIYGTTTTPDQESISMEFLAYPTVHDIYMAGSATQEEWEKIFYAISILRYDLGRFRVTGKNPEGFPAELENMYLKKTINRLEQLREGLLGRFFKSPIFVNGRQYVSLEKIEELLGQLVPWLYGQKEFTIIHGDLHFSNIFISPDYGFVKVIDPRGNFGGGMTLYGDPRYEIAKLLHSVDGKYDCIIEDRFSVSIDQNEIQYEVKAPENNKEVYDAFLKVFDPELSEKGALWEAEFIEALLFLSMIPLHAESPKHQIAMLATGIELLDRVADIRA